MNCTDCESYKRGKGTKACLRCPQYKDIIKQSGKRSTIMIDVIPDVILEAIPDKSGLDVLQSIRLLPIELSTPLMIKYVLDATEREIAEYLNISKTKVHHKIFLALEMLRKMPINDP